MQRKDLKGTAGYLLPLAFCCTGRPFLIKLTHQKNENPDYCLLRHPFIHEQVRVVMIHSIPENEMSDLFGAFPCLGGGGGATRFLWNLLTN
jgi:hypothetical protein